jgi:hypothetical protein
LFQMLNSMVHVILTIKNITKEQKPIDYKIMVSPGLNMDHIVYVNKQWQEDIFVNHFPKFCSFNCIFKSKDWIIRI